MGDSRIVLVPRPEDGPARALTVDHALPNSNVLTRALGLVDGDVGVDTLELETHRGETFVLATDGLTHYLPSPEEIARVVRKNPSNPALALVDVANQGGGHDNITAIVVTIA